MYKKLKVESFQLRGNIRILLVHWNWKSLKKLLKRGKGERLRIFNFVLTVIPLNTFVIINGNLADWNIEAFFLSFFFFFFESGILLRSSICVSTTQNVKQSSLYPCT